MLILLTNDDGIYAPGLMALEREAAALGDVCLVAPATEQSGVGHSITYLSPLVTTEVFDGPRRRGWAVEGSPADCVKLGVAEFCPRRPDLVVSGMNYGLNAGINVLYSGTVAAAIEGAFFQIPSIAVSMEYSQHAPFAAAARVARRVIEFILSQGAAGPQLYNVNIPLAALNGSAKLRVVPMDVAPYDERFERRTDPRGRSYFWAAGGGARVARHQRETDLTALRQGYVTITPLDYDLTRRDRIAETRHWNRELSLDASPLA